MKIIELKIDDLDESTGIKAISLVSFPAIEQDFIYFSKDSYDFLKTKGIKLPEKTEQSKLKTPDGRYKFWKYATRAGQSPVIDTSHDFCRLHAQPPNNVFHIDEINNWHKKISGDEKLSKGWIEESNFTKNFTGNENNFNLDQQLYNCRHYLSPIIDIDDIPSNKKYLLSKIERYDFGFSIQNEEKRIITGAVMIPNMLIFRNAIPPVYPQDFYVYFSKDTIKKLKDRYGFTKKITYQHQENANDNDLILLDSWIYPYEKDDNCGIKNLKEGSWCMKYKVISSKLWNVIKMGKLKCFSVEAQLPFNIK